MNSAAQDAKMTPLLTFLMERKAEKNRIRDEKREARRKRDEERRKNREEERRKKKEAGKDEAQLGEEQKQVRREENEGIFTYLYILEKCMDKPSSNNSN